MARLERARSLLISLLALEIAKEGTSGYRQRLTAMRDKLLAILAESEDPPRDEDLPEFREYARTKYSPELDEDLITMFEDLIDMRRQGIR